MTVNDEEGGVPLWMSSCSFIELRVCYIVLHYDKKELLVMIWS
mgnify:CR=1 FL=1